MNNMAETLHFSCTLCGKCCHDLKLPLSVSESISWLRRGGVVQVLTEAMPWPVEPPADDGPAQHKRRRSFAATSGNQPIRVIVTLAASFDGPCPHLRDDMRCGAYEARPRVCRIYPAEVNPYVKLMPTGKACPPQAWTEQHPAFERAGRILDDQTVEIIRQSRDADAQDAPLKERFVALLGYTKAALSNEGFAVYTPQPAAAREALEVVAAQASRSSLDRVSSNWTFVSNQRDTIEALVSIEARATADTKDDDGAFRYLGWRASNT